VLIVEPYDLVDLKFDEVGEYCFYLSLENEVCGERLPREGELSYV